MSARVEAHTVIRHGNVQHVVRFARQIHGDPIDLGVLDRIEEELANRLEQQRADVLAVGIRRVDPRAAPPRGRTSSGSSPPARLGQPAILNVPGQVETIRN